MAANQGGAGDRDASWGEDKAQWAERKLSKMEDRIRAPEERSQPRGSSDSPTIRRQPAATRNQSVTMWRTRSVRARSSDRRCEYLLGQLLTGTWKWQCYMLQCFPVSGVRSCRVPERETARGYYDGKMTSVAYDFRTARTGHLIIPPIIDNGL